MSEELTEWRSEIAKVYSTHEFYKTRLDVIEDSHPDIIFISIRNEFTDYNEEGERTVNYESAMFSWEAFKDLALAMGVRKIVDYIVSVVIEKQTVENENSIHFGKSAFPIDTVIEVHVKKEVTQ